MLGRAPDTRQTSEEDVATLAERESDKGHAFGRSYEYIETVPPLAAAAVDAR